MVPGMPKSDLIDKLGFWGNLQRNNKSGEK